MFRKLWFLASMRKIYPSKNLGICYLSSRLWRIRWSFNCCWCRTIKDWDWVGGWWGDSGGWVCNSTSGGSVAVWWPATTVWWPSLCCTVRYRWLCGDRLKWMRTALLPPTGSRRLPLGNHWPGGGASGKDKSGGNDREPWGPTETNESREGPESD